MSRILPVGNDEVATLLPNVLERPAAEGARIIALHWLQQLQRMRDKWREFAVPVKDDADESTSIEASAAPPDADALESTLHKARVALRRLRAVKKEHKDEFTDVFSRRTNRALRELGQATNAVRDRDVQRAWLDAELESFDAVTRAEAEALRAELKVDSEAVLERVERAFSRHFDPVAPKLARRLSWYARRERVGNGVVAGTPYAASVAARLEDGAERIRKDIETIGAQKGRKHADREVQDQLHEIRLFLKRHRALLAPLTKAHGSLAALYDIETRGQDLLGAMRDADLLSQVARDGGFGSLAEVLAGTRLSNLEAFLDQWVGHAKDVQRHFDAAIDWLRHVAYAIGDDAGSATDAVDLPMEIERKFLLRDVPPEAVAMPPIMIEQGWIPGTMLRERLRRSTYPDGRVRCTRTVKLGRPEARIEIEEDTGHSIFQAMWSLTNSARIRKRRHVVREGAHGWEIDVFSDRDLVLAEVELTREDEAVDIPGWLAPYIVREVTGDPAYLNSQMARPDLTTTDVPVDAHA